MKTEFIVADMTCNHCVQTITTAVQTAAPGALVATDLSSHRLSVESNLNAAALQALIADEGYDVRPA